MNAPNHTHILRIVECHRASVVLAAMAMQALPLLGGESPITWAGSLTQEAQPDGSVRPWRLPHEDASLYDDNRCACRPSVRPLSDSDSVSLPSIDLLSVSRRRCARN